VNVGTFEVFDELAVCTGHALVHEAGWQSWSPSGTYPVTGQSPRPADTTRHAMRFRPEVPAPATGFQSEGLLVVDPGPDAPTRIYCAEDGTEVPTIRAQLRGERLVVAVNGSVRTVLVQGGVSDALASFGSAFAQRAGAGPVRAAPTAWCSWYRYFDEVTAADIAENLDVITGLDLPVDVVQIDDGWEAGIGDWTAYSESFGDLPGLVRRIRDRGSRAGIWIAPLTVGSKSRLAVEHPDWLIGNGGRNWHQSLHGLDVTHPSAAAYLRESLAGLRTLGVDYVKLDFLYTGALVGDRHDPAVGPVEAYRMGLALVREELGSDAYLVGCGAPILPSVGLVDAMRVSGDVFHAGAASRSGSLRGEPAIRARAWQQGRFWVNDTDCLVARPSFALRREWAALIDRLGGLRSASDRISELDDWGIDTTRQLLSRVPPPVPFPSENITT